MTDGMRVDYTATKIKVCIISFELVPPEKQLRLSSTVSLYQSNFSPRSEKRKEKKMLGAI